jgi:hypothetical protein
LATVTPGAPEVSAFQFSAWPDPLQPQGVLVTLVFTSTETATRGVTLTYNLVALAPIIP